MSESWAIYIDEEGFAQHWDDTMAAFRGLNALMEAICRIGMKVYPDAGERLFCYQFGDGFLITSDFHERDLSRSVLIAISILRHMLAADRVARACLVEGDVSDIAGCYPKEVRDAPDRSRISLGAGLLITSPVLGEGLLRSVNLGKKGPRGPSTTEGHFGYRYRGRGYCAQLAQRRARRPASPPGTSGACYRGGGRPGGQALPLH